MINIQESEAVKNRTIQIPYLQIGDIGETLNFRDYRRNHMERVQENINRLRDTKWSVIKIMIDNYGVHIYDRQI